MKKIYYLLTAAAMLAPSLSSAAEKELYLVGSFNNWITPDQWEYPDAAAASEFVLTDEDGDGTYSGTFKIPEGELQFKVFAAKCGWDDRENVYGQSRSFGTMDALYSNVAYSEELVSDDTTGWGGSYNVRISNWKGGILNFEATPNEGGMTLNLTGGDNQPRTSIYNAIYLIGDFNDWKIPNGDELNGAVAMTSTEDKPTIFSMTKEFGAGNPHFAICVPTTPTSKKSFSVFGPDGVPAFTLTNGPGAEPAKLYLENPLKRYRTTDDYAKFSVADWNGGKITCSVNTANWTSEVYSMDAPAVSMEQFYVVLKVDGTTVGTVSMMDLPYSANYRTLGMGTDCKDVEMIFTTENSSNPSKESIWGIDPATVYTENTNATVRFVKGGAPYVVNMIRSGYASIRVDLNFGLANVYNFCQMLPADAEELYLNGYQVGWVNPVETNADRLIKFEKVDYGVFEAWVECPYQEEDSMYGESTMQFRFYTKLAGWVDTYSFGSNFYDFYCEPADMQNGTYTGTIFEHGLGNWGLTNWPGGDLWMRVDLVNMRLTLSTESAVDEIESADEGEAVYYDLQGARVDNPVSGLYIKVTESGSEKVYLK